MAQISDPSLAPHTQVQSQLKPGALKLSGVLMQSVTTISPAIAVLATLGFTTSVAGKAAPLAFLVAAVIALMLGVTLAQFAKHLPSAGTYFTYVSRSLGPTAGFLTAWLYFLFTPIVGAQVGTFFGTTLQSTLKSQYGINFPWWAYMLLSAVLTGAVAYRGIELSVKLLVILGLCEIGIVLALSLWGLARPGAGGVSLAGFNPANAPSFHGLFLGVIFSIFAITGWDAAAPLAEESENPKRNIPRAVLGSIILIGLFLIISSWGLHVGWGVNSLDKLASSTELPGVVLARHFWGAGWILIMLALLNSALAVAVACVTVSTRLWYSMARAGAMPKPLAKVHPRYKTPVNAIYLQTAVTLLVGLVLAAIIHPGNVYNVTGLMFTFTLIPVYVAANIGLYRFYRKEHPGEFNVLLHVVFPIVSSVALIYVGYASLVPAPSFPNNWAAPIVGIWLVIGIGVVIALKATGRTGWLLKAGAAVGENVVEDVPERAGENSVEGLGARG